MTSQTNPKGIAPERYSSDKRGLWNLHEPYATKIHFLFVYCVTVSLPDLQMNNLESSILLPARYDVVATQ